MRTLILILRLLIPIVILDHSFRINADYISIAWLILGEEIVQTDLF